MRRSARLGALALLLLAGACGSGKAPDEAAGAAKAGAASGTGPQTARQVASEMDKVTIRPGAWETEQEVVDVAFDNAPEGMPKGMAEAMKGHRTTGRSCITPEQAKKPSAEFLAAKKDSQCRYSGFEMSGGAIRGTVTCPGERGGTMRATLSGRYGPESYTMTAQLRSEGMGGPQAPGLAMRMTMRTSGKRVGACPS